MRSIVAATIAFVVVAVAWGIVGAKAVDELVAIHIAELEAIYGQGEPGASLQAVVETDVDEWIDADRFADVYEIKPATPPARWRLAGR